MHEKAQVVLWCDEVTWTFWLIFKYRDTSESPKNHFDNLFSGFEAHIIDQWPRAGSGEPVNAFSRDAPEEEAGLWVVFFGK